MARDNHKKASVEWSSARWPLLAFAFVALLHATWGTSTGANNWGVHALAFLPRAFQWGAIALLAALLVPSVAHRAGFLPSLAFRLTESRIAIFASALLALGAFYLARSEFTFLGDSVVWMNQLRSTDWQHYFEPLGVELFHLVARSANPEQPENAAGLSSIIVGPFYVIAVSYLCRMLWSEALARGLAWILLVMHPTLLFFFGYAETYPIAYMLQAVFALTLAGAALRRTPVWMALVVGALAVATHLLALTWMPALAVLALVRREPAKPDSPASPLLLTPSTVTRALLFVLLPLAAAIGVIATIGITPAQLVERLRGDTGLGGGITVAWIFSKRHVIELFNTVALLMAPCMVLWAVALERRVSAPLAWRDVLRQPAWLPIAALAVGPLFVLLLIDPRIGGARDWDLMSTVTIPVILLSVELFRIATQNHETNATRRLVAGWSVGLAAVTTAAWLAVNLDTDRALQRFVALKSADGPYSTYARSYANETLAVYYRGRDPLRERDAWRDATRENPVNARYFNQLGNAELRLDNIAGARAAFQGAYDLGMREWFVIHNLASANLQSGDLAAAESKYSELIGGFPPRWTALQGRARARIALGRPAEALPDLDQALQLETGQASLHFFRALALANLGERAQARHALQRALALDPNHGNARRLLGQLNSE